MKILVFPNKINKNGLFWNFVGISSCRALCYSELFTILEAKKRMNEINNVNDVVYYNSEFLQKRIFNSLLFIKDEFIYGGHLLSIGTSLIGLSTMILLNILIRWEFLIIIYLGTQCIYNYDHFTEFDVNPTKNSKRTNHLKKYKFFIPFLLVFYGGGYFFLLLYYSSIEAIIFGTVLIIGGLLYTLKFKDITKKVVGFKSIYTAASWGLMVSFTAIYCSYSANALLFVIILFVFLRWFVNTSICDLKDIETDKKENLLTLPIYFSKKNFLFFLHVLNSMAFILLFASILLGIAPLSAISLFFFFIYGAYYIQKAKNPKTDLSSLSNVVVDGEFILWPIFLSLGTLLISFI